MSVASLTSSFDYNAVASIPKSLLGPSFTDYTPQITQDAIDKRFIMRYFTRQVNVKIGEIVEISPTVYTALQTNTLWQTVAVVWRISGPLDDILGTQVANTPNRLYTGVTTANTNSIKAADKEMPGMVNKLNNPVQYYQFDVNPST